MSSAPTSTPDHPRACGANVADWAALSAVAGSSPRVRGKRSRGWLRVSMSRIIPARAGQTGRPSMRTSAHTDHPRACGANGEPAKRLHITPGSSPRVRGKPRQWWDEHHAEQIIPARAGQTHCLERVVFETPDHPRACGANTCNDSCNSPRIGSSPRVRGKLTAVASIRDRVRIIPARAGQTPSPSSPRRT